MHLIDSGEIVDSTEGDSQCPTCGRVVMADEIEKSNGLAPYALGFMCGVIGAVSCVTVLFLTDIVRLSWSITWV